MIPETPENYELLLGLLYLTLCLCYTYTLFKCSLVLFSPYKKFVILRNCIYSFPRKQIRLFTLPSVSLKNGVYIKKKKCGKRRSNYYRCNTRVKTTITYAGLLYFQFLWNVMTKTKVYKTYMGLYLAPTRHVFKMALLAVTWMPSSNLWHMKSQRSGQVYHTVSLRQIYYRSQQNCGSGLAIIFRTGWLTTCLAPPKS